MIKKGSTIATTSFVMIMLLITIFIALNYLSKNPGDSLWTKSSPENSISPQPTNQDIDTPNTEENPTNPNEPRGLVSGRVIDPTGSSDDSSENCFLQKITYSIGNRNITETCNEYFQEECIDKTVKCTVEIRNLDYEIGGIFKVILSFFEKDKTKEDTSYNESFEEEISPRQTITIQSSKQITEPEIVKKEITCFYETTETPEKEICN
ncbi:MAG: hypothetical protein ABIF88_00155 [archaeon]